MKLRASLACLAALALAGCMGGGDRDAWVYPSAQTAPGGYDQPGYGQPGYAQQDYDQPGAYAPAPQDARPMGQGAPGANYPAPGSDYARPSSYPATPPTAPSAYPPEAGAPPPSSGPSGSSQRAADDGRYDRVGFAEVRGLASADPAARSQVVAVHPSLAAGSFAEVTALDSGRTILVLITGPMAARGGEIALSPAAAQQLGIRGTTPVRVRRVDPPVQDQAALRSGRAAAPRIDAPEALLVGLRRQIPAAPATGAPPPQSPAPGTGYTSPGTTRAPGTGAGYYVQVAALSNQSRAQSLARSLGGFVRPAGNLFRIQMGPYATSAEAERARAAAAARGFRRRPHLHCQLTRSIA